MTIGNNIILALKYFRSHVRRHVFLLLILAFSFGIITTVTTLTEGMAQNVFRSAENHYGGHFFIIGFGQNKHQVIHTDEILAKVKNSGIPYKKTVLRTMDYSDGIVYFGGTSVKQKYVVGMDWETEQEEFLKQTFSEEISEIPLTGNWIVLSQAVADQLNARCGDDIILEVSTRFGQKNTAPFIVKGIVQDTSIFGYYKCYIDRKALNSLLDFGASDCSWIGVYLDSPDPAAIATSADGIFTLLQEDFPMSSRINNRDELAAENAKPRNGTRYPIITIDAYVSEVSDLLSAMRLISYFLYITMIIIALASMSVTYRLILHERSREIGTLRVMGMGAIGTQLVLVFEGIIIFVLSIVAGFLLSLLFSWILSLFSYSWIPGFDLFLYKGKLTAAYPAGLLATNIIILLLTTLPAVWIPAARISKIELVRVLSGETL